MVESIVSTVMGALLALSLLTVVVASVTAMVLFLGFVVHRIGGQK